MMTEEQIKHMTQRFLQWRLPKDFGPDAGISFKPHYPYREDGPPHEWPIGTNVFTATQAEAMVRHMIEGMP